MLTRASPLSQMNPVHILVSYSFKIHFNIIPRPRFFPAEFTIEILYAFSSLVHTTCSAHLIPLDLVNITIFGEEYNKVESSSS
jgi:hypothetical protein